MTEFTKLRSSPRRRGPSGVRQTTLGSRLRGNDDIQYRRVTHSCNFQDNARRRGHLRLHRDRRGFGRLRGRRAAQRKRPSPCPAAGSRRQGSQRLDPRADGILEALRQCAIQLDVRNRARGRAAGQGAVSAARQSAGRHQLDQRHVVHTRSPGGLRRLAAPRLHRLGLEQRAPLLQDVRGSGARPERFPWHRRSASRLESSVPAEAGGALDCRGDRGGIARERRFQRWRAGRRRAFPEHDQPAPPLEHCGCLSRSRAQPAESHDRNQRARHAHPDRESRRRRRCLRCQWRRAHRPRAQRGDRLRRRVQFAAIAAAVGARAGPAAATARHPGDPRHAGRRRRSAGPFLLSAFNSAARSRSR